MGATTCPSCGRALIDEWLAASPADEQATSATSGDVVRAAGNILGSVGCLVQWVISSAIGVAGTWLVKWIVADLALAAHAAGLWPIGAGLDVLGFVLGAVLAVMILCTVGAPVAFVGLAVWTGVGWLIRRPSS